MIPLSLLAYGWRVGQGSSQKQLLVVKRRPVFFLMLSSWVDFQAWEVKIYLKHPVESTSWDLNWGICCFPWSVNTCFLLSASSLNCTLQPAGCVWCSPSSQLSPLRTGRRGMLQVKSQCSGSAASGKLLHACSQSIQCLARVRMKIATPTSAKIGKGKLSSHFSFAC